MSQWALSFRRYLSHTWDFHYVGFFQSYLTMGGNDCDVFGFTMISLALDFYLYHQEYLVNLFLRVVLDCYWVVFEEKQWVSSYSMGSGEAVRYLSVLYANGLLGYLVETWWWDWWIQYIVVVHQAMGF